MLDVLNIATPRWLEDGLDLDLDLGLGLGLDRYRRPDTLVSPSHRWGSWCHDLGRPSTGSRSCCPGNGSTLGGGVPHRGWLGNYGLVSDKMMMI
jgi:hypothetical protein